MIKPILNTTHHNCVQLYSCNAIAYSCICILGTPLKVIICLKHWILLMSCSFSLAQHCCRSTCRTNAYCYWLFYFGTQLHLGYCQIYCSYSVHQGIGCQHVEKGLVLVPDAPKVSCISFLSQRLLLLQKYFFCHKVAVDV